MSKVVRLSEGNFSVVGRNNPCLAINIQGPVLVLFTIGRDQNCQPVEQLFEHMAAKSKGIMFASVDVGTNRGVVQRSRPTSTFINGVPVLIFYHSGNPIMRCNGPRSEAAINNFITKALTEISATSPPPQQQGPHRDFMSGAGRPNNSQAGGLYGPPPQSQGRGGYYKPEIETTPSVNNFIKGHRGNSSPNDDDDKFILPEGVIPHNKPWMAIVEDGV